MIKDLHAVIFDLDGTLIDSAPDIAASLTELLETYDLEPYNVSGTREMIGAGVKKLVARAFKGRSIELEGDLLNKRTNELIEIYGARPTQLTKPYAGAHETIATLHGAGVKLAICTNKPVAITSKIVEEFEWSEYFDTLIGGDSTDARKPDPKPVRAALENMKTQADHTIMVGDSAADFNAARAASVPCILVTYGYSKTPVADPGAEALIDDLRDVLPLLLPSSA